MAKKKERDLTTEELLEQALMTEGEWPYQVPENWVWTKLGHICRNVQYGYTAKSTGEPVGPKLLRITDIQDDYVDWESVPYCEIQKNDYDKFKIMTNDILVARTGATTGKSYLVEEVNDSVFASYLIRISLINGFLPKYLYQFMRSDFYWNQITDLAQGIAQPGVNATKLQTLSFPLPPLPEQQRIVDRIESLFEKLDQAKGLIQDALDSFENRKAAILHKAFSGELTRKWREENGVGMESWEDVEFEGCTVMMQNGISKRSGSKGLETVVLRLANIKGDLISEDDLRTIMLDENEHRKYAIDNDDTLIIRVNGSVDNVGRIIHITNENHWAFCDHLIRAKFNLEKVITKYMVYYGMTEQYRRYVQLNMVSSAGQNTISQKTLGKMVVPVPMVSEQIQLVKILEGIFEKENDCKELCETIDNIDLMKKSILARAFRGELGTNDPEEESALKLLEAVVGNCASVH